MTFFSRRSFLVRAATFLCGSFIPWRRASAANDSVRRPRILLRNAWQSVNIGDIGHTPGTLELLRAHFSEALVTLWPGDLGHGAREMLVAAFPELTIVEGTIDAKGQPTTPALAKAWSETDFYLSGSGSGFPASQHAAAFRRATGKPVGIFGVSLDPISGFGPGRIPEGGTLKEIRARASQLSSDHLAGDLRVTIDEAKFFFTRDTLSRDYLRSQHLHTPLIEFGPDSQLAMRLRNDAKGDAFRQQHQLESGKFISVVPRLRYTPHYRLRDSSTWTAEDLAKEEINRRTVEADNGKLRDLIVRYVRSTGHRVLVVPEMTYQIELGKQYLVDPLPDDVKSHVVWRSDFWLPDEAAAVYAHAAVVVSMECHSPLIAFRNGTPAIYVRQPTDTCKGQMYRDLGTPDWFFEIEETSGPELFKTVEGITKDLPAARAHVASVMVGVDQLQRRMVSAVRAAVGK